MSSFKELLGKDLGHRREVSPGTDVYSIPGLPGYTISATMDVFEESTGKHLSQGIKTGDEYIRVHLDGRAHRMSVKRLYAMAMIRVPDRLKMTPLKTLVVKTYPVHDRATSPRDLYWNSRSDEMKKRLSKIDPSQDLPAWQRWLMLVTGSGLLTFMIYYIYIR